MDLEVLVGVGLPQPRKWKYGARRCQPDAAGFCRGGKGGMPLGAEAPGMPSLSGTARACATG